MYPLGCSLRVGHRSILSVGFQNGGLRSTTWKAWNRMAGDPRIITSTSSQFHSAAHSVHSCSDNFILIRGPLTGDVVFSDSCRLGLVHPLMQTRLFQTSRNHRTKGKEETPASNSSKKPSSKVEESVKAIQTDLKEKEKVPPVKRSIWKRIEDEILHYYHGFRLLVLETRISIGLINRVLNGHSLSRREHRQLVRTTSDLFRLVPFSVFIIVPFMEFLLPVFLKFFPGMLPSTFQTKNDRENKMKAELKVKLEMAKFLQQTLDDMSLESKGHSSEKAKEFAAFFHKIRTSGTEVTNEEIIKYSKLFEDEITLDSLTRQQLVALCHVLEIPALGNNTMLRFQLRMRLRSLASDDRTIEREGIESLSVSELQLACKARGMRAIGIAEDRLRRQLSQWLQLSLHEKVPPSLLLLSRAMYLPDDLPESVRLQHTISSLPDSAATHAKAAIGEREGKVDHKTRIEVIQEEDRKIKEERQDALKEKKLAAPKDKEVLVDPAPTLSTDSSSEAKPPPEEHVKPSEDVPAHHEHPVEEILEPRPPLSSEMVLLTMKRDPRTVSEIVAGRLCRNVPHPIADLLKEGISKDDMANIEGALDTLGSEKKRLYIEKEELKDLKAEMADYKEDIQDLHVLTKTGVTPVEVRESKAAKRLYKRVNRMISSMDTIVEELHKEEDKLICELKGTTDAPEEKKGQLVATEELIDAIQRLQKVSDPARLARISDVIKNLDLDSDGHVKVDDVLKVIELIGRENVKLSPKQVSEIVQILSKEECFEKGMEKPPPIQQTPGPQPT